MKQITAKEQAIINKWAYHMRESAISEEDAIKEAFLELRSVSETKEENIIHLQNRIEALCDRMNKLKEQGLLEIFLNQNTEEIKRIKQFLFPVPVSEVGQMEEKDIQKLAFERYPVNEQGLVSGWEDINKDLREGFIEGLKMRLPVPNTKTKWDRLNSELDTALANMTDEDWDKIKNKRKKELPNTKTVEGDTLILEIAVDVEHELRRVMKENNRSVLDDHVQDIIHRNVTGIFDHNKSKYLRLLSSLRSKEPEREGHEGTVDLFKYFNSKGIYSNGTGNVLLTINGDNIVNKLKEIFSEILTTKPSPPLKALSEENKITRIEVIDYLNKKGRVFVHWDKNSKVELSHQDNGRTLKIFIDSAVPEVKEKGDSK